MSLIIYGHEMSSPCRAVMIFFKLNGIVYEFREIQPYPELLTDEKIPCMTVDGATFHGATAILIN